MHSYCNRERETRHLRSLLDEERTMRVVRRVPSTPPQRTAKRLSPETNAAIVADYRSGMKIAAVARKYGVNEWTVHHRLKLAGVAKRPNSRDPRKIELVHALRGDGLTYKRIAARVGFSATTVRTILQRSGS